MKTIPSVRRGKPDEHEMPEYEMLNISGVIVYAHKSLDEYGALEIAADNSFFGDKLVLRGVPQDSSKGCG